MEELKVGDAVYLNSDANLAMTVVEVIADISAEISRLLALSGRDK